MIATRLRHRGTSTLPCIRATVVAGKDDVNIRISDQGNTNSFCRIISFSPNYQAVVCWPPVSRPLLISFRSLTSGTPLGWSARAWEHYEPWARILEVSWLRSKSKLDIGNNNKCIYTLRPMVLNQRQMLGWESGFLWAIFFARKSPLWWTIDLFMSCMCSYFGGSLELVSLDGWGLSFFLIMCFYILKYVSFRYRCICEATKARKHYLTLWASGLWLCICQGTNLEGIEL